MNWAESLIALAEQVQTWVTDALVNDESFVVHVITMVPTSEEPLLKIEASGNKRLLLEPTRHRANQVPTSVNLYAYPSMRRAVLVGPAADGSWEIQSGEGVPMKYDWSGDGFMNLLTELARNHESSSL